MKRSECLLELEGIFWGDTYRQVQEAGRVLDAYVSAQRAELLAAAKFALKSLEAASDAMGGDQHDEIKLTGKTKRTKGYYLEARRDLQRAIDKAEGKK